MRYRVRIVLTRETSAASISLEFHLTSHEEMVSTGEIFELIQPALRDDNSGFNADNIDVLIDVGENDMDYILPRPDGRYFDVVKMYERVFVLFDQDNRFNWEV